MTDQTERSDIGLSTFAREPETLFSAELLRPITFGDSLLINEAASVEKFSKFLGQRDSLFNRAPRSSRLLVGLIALSAIEKFYSELLGRLKLDQSRRQSSETSVINFQAEFDAAKALAFELLQELIENKTRSNWKLAVSALNKSCVFILSAFGQLIVEISLNSREQVESHFEQLGANLLRLGSVLDKLGLEAKTLADEISAANGLSS